MVCQHCKRDIRNKFALHVEYCPLAPQHKERYRSAMENPHRPGVLLMRMEYDERRPPGLPSGSSLNHAFKLSWVEIGKLFGLRPEGGEEEESVIVEIGELVEQDRAIQAEERSRGLPVLRHRTEIVGDVYRRTYMLR